MKTHLLPLILLTLVPLGLLAASTDEIDGLIFAGQLDTAEAAIAEMAKTDPDSPDILYLNGRLYLAKGQTGDSLAALQKAVKMEPDRAQFHSALGTAYVRHAETLPFMERPMFYMQSIDSWKKAVSLDSDSLEGHMGLAYYYMNAPAMGGGSLVLAADHAKEVIRLNPELGEPLLEQVKARKEPGMPPPEAPSGN